MNIDAIFDMASVTAGHGDGHCYAAAAAQVEHQAIALGKTALGDFQPPQAVAFEGVGTGEEDDELRLRRGQRGAHPALDSREIGLVAGTVRQLDIEITALFVKRIIVGRMHGEGIDAGVVGADRSGAVALMHVAIHDRNPFEQPFRLERARRNRRIVEDAIALAAVAKSVMRPTREIDSDTVDERGARRSERRTARAARALHHLWRPGKADAALLLCAEGPGLDVLEI